MNAHYPFEQVNGIPFGIAVIILAILFALLARRPKPASVRVGDVVMVASPDTVIPGRWLVLRFVPRVDGTTDADLLGLDGDTSGHSGMCDVRWLVPVNGRAS